MFMIVFMAYAQFGYLLFGPKLYDFSKMSYSAYTLMRTMLGDFDFPAFQVDHLKDDIYNYICRDVGYIPNFTNGFLF